MPPVQPHTADSAVSLPPRSGDRVALLLWVLFVVYGSLVPLEFKLVPFDEAWARFQAIRFLDLGVDQRADWVANGLLYLPVGALGALVFTPERSGIAWRVVAMLLAALGAAMLAVSVEFTQIFFPQRTVSLNDLIAEGIGGVVGSVIGAAWLPRHWPRHGWWQRLNLPVMRWVWLYGGALVLLALFPFDLLLSVQEWQQKLEGGRAAWWRVHDDSDGGSLLRLFVGSAAEALLMLPLAWALARHRVRGGGARGPLHGLAWGLVLGLAIEVGQLAMASGISQGLSVLTRGVGMAAGVWVFQRSGSASPQRLADIVRSATAVAWLPYGLLLAALAGWFGGPWRSPDEALARLTGEVRFIPFYYHYFVSEVRAMSSLLGVAAMYAPVALWAWARRGGAGRAAGLAAMVCTVIEIGKLFAAGARPDPTNVLVAAVAAGLLAAWLAWRLPMGRPVDAPAGRPAPASAWAALMLAGAVWTVSGPWAFPAPTTAVLIGALALVWWRPAAAAGLLLALALVADPRPWSGLLLIDEVDTAMAAVLALAWYRSGHLAPVRSADRALSWVLAAIAVSMLLGVGRSVLAWWHSPAPFWAAPGGGWQPLQMAKAVLWGSLMAMLVHAQVRRGLAPARPLAWGLSAALVGTAAWQAWEWLGFRIGPTPTDDFRPSGPLADMALGGAANEAVLLFTLPWLAAAAWMTRSWALRAVLTVAAFGGGWAVLTTQTRAAHVALALGLALLAVTAATAAVRHRPAPEGRARARPRRAVGIAAVALLSVAAWLGLITLAGPAAERRLAEAPEEMPARLARLADAMALHDGSVTSWLLGMGWARFPPLHYWAAAPEDRVSSLAVDATRQPPVLVLGVGRPTYVEQVLLPGHHANALDLRVRWRARGGQGDGILKVMVCRKWHLNARACAGQTLMAPAGEAWQTDSVRLDIAGVLAARAGAVGAPLKLSVFNGGARPLEIQGLQLQEPTGIGRLAATDFGRGMQRWDFASDDHLAWHLKSLPLGLLFERGVLGTAAVAALLTLVLHRARGRADGVAAPEAVRALRWMAPATVLMSLVIGAWDMPLDAPRYQLLWLAAFGALAALLRPMAVKTAAPPLPRVPPSSAAPLSLP